MRRMCTSTLALAATASWGGVTQPLRQRHRGLHRLSTAALLAARGGGGGVAVIGELCRGERLLAPGRCAAIVTAIRGSSTAAAPPPTPVSTQSTRDDVRNIAVIAHVDHGKTTLVDSMLKQSGTFEAKNRVMDSKDQERERGITILAKNTSILMKDGRRVNIVDTPGHLDFSGEVERALQMVEGFILLVDAKEGVKPGTRYVLRKALKLNLKAIVVLNKIDKDDTNLAATEEQIQDLFLEVASNDDQLDIFFMYGSGRDGYINDTPLKEGTLTPLFDNIFTKIPAPRASQNKLQMLVAQLDQDPVTGMKIAIGRIFGGKVVVDQKVTVVLQEQQVNALVRSIKTYRGIDKVPATEAEFGEIVSIALQEPVDKKIPLHIGATICAEDCINPLTYHPPDEPTYSLTLMESQAPWKGKETGENFGRLQSIKARLEREAMINTALKLEGMDTGRITLLGRGPLHLSVIIEDMRREGFEFEVSAPSVMTKTIDGEVCEPWEKVVLEFKESLSANVVSALSNRMGEVLDIKQLSNGRVVMDALMPVRLMAGFPVKFHTLTSGDGVLNHSFDSYRPMAHGDTERDTGALISVEKGLAQEYSMSHLGSQGRFFVVPGDEIHYGQIVGENTKTKLQNLGLNICKKNEQLAGMRANATDAAKSKRAPFSAVRWAFEDAIAWVVDDELVTVTPKSIRMRKPNFNGRTSMRSLSSGKK